MGRADLWISGEVVKQSSSFEVEGIADLYVSVPRPDRVYDFLIRIMNLYLPPISPLVML